jgi:hypothetical protein
MVMGYHKIELKEGEGPKTAFSTKQGHWDYRRLPFGLKTAPATYQKPMNTIERIHWDALFCLLG